MQSYCDVNSKIRYSWVRFHLVQLTLKLPQTYITHQQGGKCSYWGCQVTQRLVSATHTPDFKAVAVMHIVRHAKQKHTVYSRDRHVIEHDTLDLCVEGGQCSAVRRRHKRQHMDFELCSAYMMSSAGKMDAKNWCSGRVATFFSRNSSLEQ